MKKINIYIRPLKETDADISWRWRNDQEIWKFTGNRPYTLVTQTIEKEWIRKVLSEDTSRRFAICIKETDEYIGNIQLTDIDLKKKQAVLHIFIGEKKYWGKGIASQATSSLIEIAKKELFLKRIILRVNRNNDSAIRVYLKNGFAVYNEAEFSSSSETGNVKDQFLRMTCDL